MCARGVGSRQAGVAGSSKALSLSETRATLNLSTVLGKPEPAICGTGMFTLPAMYVLNSIL